VISSNRLEPGSVGQVKVTVDTAGKMGNLEKYVTVYTNDRVTPVITFTLTLEVLQK
jgi:hypothetical protein